ncbi:DUF2651 family protein [Heliophilum fasciatum]|uniref:DUF2651 family protein n=1 Tax=Heliophilum fasciatum TaxID=35700 RepID=UPI001A9BA6BD
MELFSINHNPFGMVLVILPLFTFIASIVVNIILKNKLIVVSLVSVIYLIATFTIFNSSFLIWCLVYTIISLIGTYVADGIIHLWSKHHW